ncbi:hypothetical protein GIB67_033439 [Kingdonia uniflora]|uniref:Ankyrin repeat domain-containing protein n=1 Tax=Kingdonia uniflora TaxID=39325 RepID=A0A7J7LU87_9MAGN|nr:hypothetical protein GIB67_033439 [Kingdonia uniflora]
MKSSSTSFLKPQTQLFSILHYSPLTLSPPSFPSSNQTQTQRKPISLSLSVSLNSFSPSNQRSQPQPQNHSYPQHSEDPEEEEHVVGDCVVFEDGIFEDPFLQNDFESNGNNPIKKKSKASMEFEPENLVPDKWKEVQAEINITKKEKKIIAQQIEFGSRLEKKNRMVPPMNTKEYLSYKEFKLAHLKPVVLDNPTFSSKNDNEDEDEEGEDEEGRGELGCSSSGRVVPRNPRLAVYRGTLDGISEFFNSGDYEPGENAGAKSEERNHDPRMQKFLNSGINFLLNLAKIEAGVKVFDEDNDWLYEEADSRQGVHPIKRSHDDHQVWSAVLESGGRETPTNFSLKRPESHKENGRESSADPSRSENAACDLTKPKPKSSNPSPIPRIRVQTQEDPTKPKSSSLRPTTTTTIGLQSTSTKGADEERMSLSLATPPHRTSAPTMALLSTTTTNLPTSPTSSTMIRVATTTTATPTTTSTLTVPTTAPIGTAGTWDLTVPPKTMTQSPTAFQTAERRSATPTPMVLTNKEGKSVVVGLLPHEKPELDMPEEMRRSPIVNVKLLSPYHCETIPPMTLPPLPGVPKGGDRVDEVLERDVSHTTRRGRYVMFKRERIRGRILLSGEELIDRRLATIVMVTTHVTHRPGDFILTVVKFDPRNLHQTSCYFVFKQVGPRKLFTKEEKVLLNKRIPNLPDATSGKWLPLHTLAASGEFYLVDALLKHNVDINAADKDGLTALHKAILCKKQAVANYLLRESANPLVRDKEGATLMHYAVQIASLPTIKILLLYNVEINLADDDGWTPLHLAVQTRRTDVVRLLLIKGADKTLRNKDGLTPLDMCLYSGRDTKTYELIKILKHLPKIQHPPL